MDDRLALTTAARRYCLERAPALGAALREQMYTHPERIAGTSMDEWEALAGTPIQRDVLGGILRRIEFMPAETFSSVEELRTFLLQTGREASYWNDLQPIYQEEGRFLAGADPIEEHPREAAQERTLFCRYIQSLTAEDLRGVPPLPHRRRLGDDEVERLWQRLQRTWQIPPDDFWWPLGRANEPPPDVLAFNDCEVRDHIPLQMLRGWLREHRAWPVLEFNTYEYDEDFELDLRHFVPQSTSGEERYWTSERMDWVMYASHENSITVGGAWLLNLIKRQWPEWEQHLRTTHVAFVSNDESRTGYSPASRR